MAVQSATRRQTTAEQLGLFGPLPEQPSLPSRPCDVCGAWGAFGMSWPLTVAPIFWCPTHRPADYFTRRPQ